jgi:rhodanese-related sulfurtransferase
MSLITQINPHDTFEELKNDKNSVLVDVRTFVEFNFVGFVNPAAFGDRMILLPWQLYPEMEENPEFDNSLEASIAHLIPEFNKSEIKIFFLCRTGARSDAAAAHALNTGYKNCYNITSGFEGSLNEGSHRGKVNGWKASHLPWRQK